MAGTWQSSNLIDYFIAFPLLYVDVQVCQTHGEQVFGKKTGNFFEISNQYQSLI
ncbi:hypothetical protein Phum_PHUM503200 [Pediculus humanus corporis]|uniref:Uncharacterized protein n=1 Tax=Pediculus humanus subsp. corporis TaxID=121224 RepID=E0VXN8_PEDHC|nr:uncharacterized protein Phum_PHUM503200 [Pediculus humanus corporis]EEB18144.1 hypothetical protein Phum_PHUM503200 [Pediculus humanus corporis]